MESQFIISMHTLSVVHVYTSNISDQFVIVHLKSMMNVCPSKENNNIAGHIFIDNEANELIK